MTTTVTTPLVLFLCTGNSCRSQMAEAILRARAGDRFRAASAGMSPKAIHPLTIFVLAESGISSDALRSKDAAEFLGKHAVRHAIVVCESAQAQCPRVYPMANEMHFWPFDDPAAFEGTEEETLAEFRRVRDQI
ncbi:MAG: arsenate reductase ArsC, partial [Phycisphaerales bacterium]